MFCGEIGCLIVKFTKYQIYFDILCTFSENFLEIIQVQAIGMYGAAQPDFFKSETNGGIKNIISYHLKIIKRCVFSPNLEVVAQKISLPRP